MTIVRGVGGDFEGELYIASFLFPYICILSCASLNLGFGLKGSVFHSFISFWWVFDLVTGLLANWLLLGG